MLRTSAVSLRSPSLACSVLITSQRSSPRYAASAGRRPAGPSTNTIPGCSSMGSPSSISLFSTSFDPKLARARQKRSVHAVFACVAEARDVVAGGATERVTSTPTTGLARIPMVSGGGSKPPPPHERYSVPDDHLLRDRVDEGRRRVDLVHERARHVVEERIRGRLEEHVACLRAPDAR